MNKSLLVGRISQTPNIFKTKTGGEYARATIAINREFSKDETDFINLTIFGKTCEYVKKYVGKGDLVSIEGSIQTSSWKDGDEVKSSWSVVVNNIRHLEPRSVVLERSEKSNANNSTQDFTEEKKSESKEDVEPWDIEL